MSGFFFIENVFFHTIFFDYGFLLSSFPNFSQILTTSPHAQIHTLSFSFSLGNKQANYLGWESCWFVCFILILVLVTILFPIFGYSPMGNLNTDIFGHLCMNSFSSVLLKIKYCLLHS